mmetsp:Transcript_590/g.1426  ORF Transcript_590/g.1426 Transcript_590/m.1426 type:complete len:320 (-) Transcript_590:13-972(-)
MPSCGVSLPSFPLAEDVPRVGVQLVRVADPRHVRLALDGGARHRDPVRDRVLEGSCAAAFYKCLDQSGDEAVSGPVHVDYPQLSQRRDPHLVTLTRIRARARAGVDAVLPPGHKHVLHAQRMQDAAVRLNCTGGAHSLGRSAIEVGRRLGDNGAQLCLVRGQVRHFREEGHDSDRLVHGDGLEKDGNVGCVGDANTNLYCLQRQVGLQEKDLGAFDVPPEPRDPLSRQLPLQQTRVGDPGPQVPSAVEAARDGRGGLPGANSDAPRLDVHAAELRDDLLARRVLPHRADEERPLAQATQALGDVPAHASELKRDFPRRG